MINYHFKIYLKNLAVIFIVLVDKIKHFQYGKEMSDDFRK